MSVDAIFFFAVLFILGGLGFVLGRRSAVLLVILAPVVLWWIWGELTKTGPDDELTQIAAGALGLVSAGAVLLGIAGRWLIYGLVLIWTRTTPETRPRRF